jgi:hypothetical protein
MSASTPYERSDAEHRGPPLLVLAIVSTVLFVGSIATTAIMTQGGHLPSPYDPTNGAVAFFSEHADAMCVNAFLQLGAAIVLGLFAATAVSRLRFLGVTAAGATIALFGGVAGSVFAASSALVQWVLASMDPTTLPIMSSGFHWLYFALGGPGHVAFTGLLVAGVSVSGGLAGLLPRWILWSGLVLAVIAEVSTVILVVPAAVFLLPVARLLTFVWMIAVGATLPKWKGAPTRSESRLPPLAVDRVPQAS